MSKIVSSDESAFLSADLISRRRKSVGCTSPRRDQSDLTFFYLGRGLSCTEEAFLPPTLQPLVWILAPPIFFLFILLSLWTALRLNPSSAKQWISQMQPAVMYRAKHYKKHVLPSLVFEQSFQGSTTEMKQNVVRVEFSTLGWSVPRQQFLVQVYSGDFQPWWRG